jgi:hypothetical protein
MSDNLVAETGTHTTHNIHKRRTSLPPEGFETAIPAIKRLHTYALDRTATGVWRIYVCFSGSATQRGL